ncbi:metallophosphoesterase [Nocardioides sp. ChNu-153]|uniref:metallophosphoesterase n=1 Tax=unclassified Nocardioides TaxID=2615069 RepID=UPI0024053BF2|nr:MULTISPECIES: metallophosphoesterase [unclassified Nocardioides]MDF9715347.1 metallophosphoesterase [Nocardioides sp. ChNu-99]MDN7121752.1 metallophosphoesterase [Nocardioides sp. ChNu-153]
MIWLGGALALLVLVGWVTWLVRRLAVAPAWGDVLGPRGAARVRRGTVAVAVLGVVAFAVAEVVQRTTDPAPWRPLLWLGLTAVALAWYLTLGLLLVAVTCGVLRLARRPAARLRTARWGAVLAVLAATGTTAYGHVEAAHVRTTEHEVVVADLGDGLDGLRVAFISDLHVGPVRDDDFVRAVVEQVAGTDADLVVLGGDYADGLHRHVGPYLDPLGDLDAPYGVVAVTGNHEFLNGDADELVARLEGLGITVLANESVTVEAGGARLVVAGVHDAIGTGASAPDPGAALAGTSPDDAILFVAHEPSQVVTDRGVDVQLSGHTHGGQLWPFGWFVRLDQPTVAGVDDVDGVTLVTGRGAGAWGPPVRVGAPPEVVVVTLRAG